jgi:hypothetical protein
LTLSLRQNVADSAFIRQYFRSRQYDPLHVPAQIVESCLDALPKSLVRVLVGYQKKAMELP